MKAISILVSLTLVLAFTLNAAAAVCYVNVNNATPTAPYTSWATAATNIQVAVDAASNGDLILVTNGVYRTGGRSVGANLLVNRVAVEKPLRIQSVNGPPDTMIQGHQVPVTTNGDGAVRCVYLTDGAWLSGFTLTNGATRSAGDTALERSGGGVWCVSTNAWVSNCVIAGNSAFIFGGGAYDGTLTDCTLTGNSSLAFGGGTYYSTLNNCTLTSNTVDGDGGGAGGWGTLNGCTLTGNSATGSGGGAYNSTLNNCTLTGNTAAVYGGASYYAYLNNCIADSNSALIGGGDGFSTLNNCTLKANSAELAGGTYGSSLFNCTLTGNSATGSGGGVHSSNLRNCIVYFNTAGSKPNYQDSILNNCCTIPNPGGAGNITNAPLFVNQAGGNFRLQSNSPCINAGRNAFVSGLSTDADGNPRIKGGTVDMGAFEFQTPSSVLAYAWAQQYGLLTDGSADYVDTDGDQRNNWQEWTTGTVPTNAASVLQMLTPSNGLSGVKVSWQSVTNVRYFLERTTNLSLPPAFVTLRTNLPGQTDSMTYTDTNATGSGPFFYRVGVQ